MSAERPRHRTAGDLVFLVDSMGSMGGVLPSLSKGILDLVRGLISPPPGRSSPAMDLRVRVLGFRDFKEDGAHWWEDNAFVRDVADLQRQISSLKTEGGGELKSLLDALWKAAAIGETGKGDPEDPTKWRPRYSAFRVVAVFTDGPFRETTLIPEFRQRTLADVQALIMANRIRAHFVAPRGECYDQLTLMDRSWYYPLVDDSDRDLPIEEFFRDPVKSQVVFKSIREELYGPVVGFPDGVPKI
jgi:hypothetical protein